MNAANAQCVPGATVSPLSGTEPEWTPEKWRTNEKYNNCYVYAIDDHNELRDRKTIPGVPASFYTCSQIIEGLKSQIPEIYPTTFDCQCSHGFNKIYTAVSDDGDSHNNDFHFWRLDRDGQWSHKPGSNSPMRVDWDNRPIQNPEHANRISPERAYVKGCGFFCVPDGTKISN